MAAAVSKGSTDAFLSTLLMASVLVPVGPDAAPDSRPGDPGFAWRTEQIDGDTYALAFTSPQRLRAHCGQDVPAVRLTFLRLIRVWSDHSLAFAVNPGTPVGATLPAAQMVALAQWSGRAGRSGAATPIKAGTPIRRAMSPIAPVHPGGRPQPTKPVAAAGPGGRPELMQKAIRPAQVPFYLDRGYDRVSGFVQRAADVAHLRSPAEVIAVLGLSYPGSAIPADATELYLLRWLAYHPQLYRNPLGGRDDTALQTAEAWVVERPPFRGDGFAPGEGSAPIVERKVDSVRLPHGAQLLRLTAEGEQIIGVFDADRGGWRRRDGKDA